MRRRLSRLQPAPVRHHGHKEIRRKAVSICHPLATRPERCTIQGRIISKGEQPWPDLKTCGNARPQIAATSTTPTRVTVKERFPLAFFSRIYRNNGSAPCAARASGIFARWRAPALPQSSSRPEAYTGGTALRSAGRQLWPVPSAARQCIPYRPSVKPPHQRRAAAVYFLWIRRAPPEDLIFPGNLLAICAETAPGLAANAKKPSPETGFKAFGCLNGPDRRYFGPAHSYGDAKRFGFFPNIFHIHR